MLSEWKNVTIEEISDSRPNALSMGPFGSNIKTDNFVPVGVPVIRGINLNHGRFNLNNFVFITEEKADELKSANAFPDDIVFTHRGTLGQISIIPHDTGFERFVISQSQMKLSCNCDLIDPYYVYYFFRSPQGQHELLKHTSTTGVPAISRPLTSLKQITLPLPPMSQQKEIVNFLKIIDSKIELNLEINEILYKICRTIFKHWFIDFEFPNSKNEPYFSSGGDMFSTELGNIPKNWSVQTMNDVCSFIGNGGTPSRSRKDFWDAGTIPWFKTGELSDSVLIESEEKITEKGFKNSSVKLLEKNSVVIAIYAAPTVGRLGLFRISGTTNQACTALIANTSKVSHFHLFYTLYFLRNKLNSVASGSAQQNISKKIIESQKIIIPPLDLISYSEEIFESFWMKIENNISQNKKLLKLKNAILPKIYSQKIQITAL